MKAKAGFTLIELVMVIVILAIISSLAVTKFGSMREDSARKVSIANQQALSRAVETYLAVNHGTDLNRLDSLIDEGTPIEGTEGFDFCSQIFTDLLPCAKLKISREALYQIRQRTRRRIYWATI